jgi:alanine racemase
MSRPIEALVHHDALRHNLARVRRSAPDAKVWAVVKAGAYGHGLRAALAGLGDADGFALLEVGEATALREAGWRGPILLLEGCFDAREMEQCSRLNVWHVVHCHEQIEQLATLKTDHPHHVFLKMNSGMNRLGLRPDAFRGAYTRLAAMPQVAEVSLMTHLANADRDAHDTGTPPSLIDQLDVFERACAGLAGERSIANSAALLRFGPGGPHASDPRRAAVHADWVRPGIMLYGSSPDHPEHDAAHWGLRATMTLRSRIIGVQTLQAGEAVGYGSLFRATAPTRVGLVACGYADGYPRHATNHTPVLVDGVKTRLAGRVSMDVIAVDLGPVPQAGIGSEVTLWGQGPGGVVLPIDEVAASAGTVGYELMCAVASRVPRVDA